MPFSDERPFIAEPSVQPYYVHENEPGPLLECAIAAEFRDRQRFEPQWTRIASGTPKYVAAACESMHSYMPLRLDMHLLSPQMFALFIGSGLYTKN